MIRNIKEIKKRSKQKNIYICTLNYVFIVYIHKYTYVALFKEFLEKCAKITSLVSKVVKGERGCGSAGKV